MDYFFTTSAKDISASNWPILKSLDIFNVYVNSRFHFWINDNLQLIYFFRKFRSEINLYRVKMCYFHNFIKGYLSFYLSELKAMTFFTSSFIRNLFHGAMQTIFFFRKFRSEINLYWVKKVLYFHNFIKGNLGLKFDDLKTLEHF